MASSLLSVPQQQDPTMFKLTCCALLLLLGCVEAPSSLSVEETLPPPTPVDLMGVPWTPPTGTLTFDTSTEDVCDGAFDFTIEAARIKGTLHVEGSSRLLEPSWIVWVDTITGAEYWAELQETRYDLLLLSSRYHIYLATDAQDLECYRCKVATLGQDVAIDHTTTMDFDLTWVSVTLTLSMNDTILPDEAVGSNRGRGHWIWRDHKTHAQLAVPLERTGPAEVTVEVPMGQSYDVYWRAPRRFYETEPHLFPGGIAHLGELAVEERSVREHYNVETLRVSGLVTLEHETLPDDALLDGWSRGLVELYNTHDPGLTGVAWAGVGEEGPGVFEVHLFAHERYSAFFRTRGANYQSALEPSREVELCDGTWCPIEASSGLTFNVSLEPRDPGRVGVRVHAQLTFDGEVPEASERRLGVLEFRSRDPERWGYSGQVKGDGSFEGWPSPGRYDVWFLSRGEYGSVLGEALVAEDWLLEAETTVEWALKTVWITGELRVNGAQYPEDPEYWAGERATLELVHASGAVSRVPLSSTGPALYEQRVLAGSYDVRLVTFYKGRIYQYYAQSLLPLGTAQLGTWDVEGTGGGVVERDFNVDVQRVSGDLTVSGESVLMGEPEFGDARPTLRFVDDQTGEIYRASIDPEEGSYSLVLYTGSYHAEVGADRFQDSGWGHFIESFDSLFFPDPALRPFGSTALLTGCELIVE